MSRGAQRTTRQLTDQQLAQQNCQLRKKTNRTRRIVRSGYESPGEGNGSAGRVRGSRFPLLDCHRSCRGSAAELVCRVERIGGGL